MILVAVAWLYVVLMIAVVEATGSQGSLLGAAVTVLLYGVLPMGLVMYLLLSPARRRARRAAESALVVEPPSSARPLDPDRGRHPAGDAVAPEREEP